MEKSAELQIVVSGSFIPFHDGLSGLSELLDEMKWYVHHKKNSQDHFNVLRRIQKNPQSSQRELAEELGFSLGKLNYCLKALKAKGLIKIANFKKNPNKLNYIYVLTPKGISEKTKLTVNFMKRKMSEYDELKAELGKNKNVDNN